MGGATSVMPVIRDAFSQQAADITQWADTIEWTVRCYWLKVASNNIVQARGVARNLFWGYKSFFGGIKLLNSRSGVIFTP